MKSEIFSRGNNRWLVRYPRALPLAIFVLVIAITTLSVFVIERGERRQEATQLSRAAETIATALERRASASSSYLRAGAALFGSVEEVRASLFRRFVNELRFDSDYRGAEGIGWAPVVPVGRVAAFEQEMDRQVPGKLVVKPRSSVRARSGEDDTGALRDVVVPITFLQPDTERNRRAIGFDLYSEAIRRGAMDRAVETLRPTASGSLVLVQEGAGTQSGFIMYMPVFQQRGGERMLAGFVFSPFNAQDFLDSVISPEMLDNRGVVLFDGQPGEGAMMARRNPGPMDGRSQSAQLRVGGRLLTVQVRSARGGFLSMLSMITLLFGLAVASLSMAIARLLTQQAYEDQASLEFFAEQNSIRNSLTRELNHRVKNTLANVLSIVSLTRRRAKSLEEFADGIDGRIRALSATHDLLTQSEWGTTPIRDVVETELAVPTRDEEARLVIEGPRVELAPNDALSLGLAIHELATNAAKFGALSVPGGEVRVSWSLVDDHLARIEWTERNGPLVREERQRGFGLDLIEKIVAHELKHPVDLRFEPEGVRCTLSTPVRKPSEFAMRARSRRPHTPARKTLSDLAD